MTNLPSPAIVQEDKEVRIALHSAYYQAEDQAKAAVRGDHAPRQRPIDYILLVGPYWAHVTVGPFSKPELTVRTHKPSNSGDFKEAFEAQKRLEADPPLRKLFLLGTAGSAIKLEAVVTSTDGYGEAAMQEALTHPPWGQ